MRDTSLFQKAPEGCPGETPSFWISTRGLLATDDSTSFPPGWTIHQPFRPLQQRQIQLHANPPAPPFISFCRGKKHPHQPMQQKNTTHPNSSHLGMLGGQDTLLCLGWKGDVWSLGKKKGAGKRGRTPTRGGGTGVGTGTGMGRESRLCGSALHQRGPGIFPWRPGASVFAWSGAQQKMLLTQNSAEV